MVGLGPTSVSRGGRVSTRVTLTLIDALLLLASLAVHTTCNVLRDGMQEIVCE
jgi:hypothetical protein